MIIQHKARYIFIKNLIFTLVIIILFYSSNLLIKTYQLPKLKISKQDSAININPFLKFFIAGQNRILADTIWISTLIEGDLEHFKDRSSGSWMFYRFNSITDFDPFFLRAYTVGGKYLNIVKDDLYGSEIIFLKGLKLYPNDYDLNYNLAFLYAFELERYKEAVKHYKKILYFPQTPLFIKSLVVKLEYENKLDLNISFNSLLEIYSKEPNDTLLKKKIHDELYAIKAQIDLECLNSKKSNCSTKDFDNNPYTLSNDIFKASKEFKQFRLYKR